MPDDYYYAEGRRVPLRRRADLVAVRLREPDRVRRGLASPALARLLAAFPVVQERPDARLTLLRVPGTRGAAPALRDLAALPDVELVEPVYSHAGSDEPILVTDEFVCQFKPGVSRQAQAELHRAHGVEVVAPLEFLPGGFVLRVDPARGEGTVATANRYHESGLTRFAHADFLKPRAPRAAPPSLLEREWHLLNLGQSGGVKGADARVRRAWEVSRGAREITVAVIDDGFDLAHRDFFPAARIVAPLDARTGSRDPGPRSAEENHGTAVLGVVGACGKGSGVFGVAPLTSLMPIRLDGSERVEAAAIAGAARAGADVISCSWGPPDGAWWNPADPLHRRVHPLPDVVAAAMRQALETGRGGRGSLIVWAAGNGNESVSNDGYARAPWVLAVAASNHRDRRSAYSDHGPEVALSAPSSDIRRDGTIEGGIHTSDRLGDLGYSPGAAYTDSFGGTSAAAPLVAGVAALVLAVNPELGAAELRALLEDTAEPIDPRSPTWKKRRGKPHSSHYGRGRIDAQRALQAAGQRPGKK